jgi:hypothetical protein
MGQVGAGWVPDDGHHNIGLVPRGVKVPPIATER